MSDHKILLLGLGMQGKAALYDLVRNDLVSEIFVVDKNPDIDYIQKLDSDKVRALQLDASDREQIFGLMDKVDLVIELLPPGFSFHITELAVEKGVNLVSTMYLLDPEETDEEKVKSKERALKELDENAKDRGIVILPEFGLDPGLDLILAKQAVRELDEVDELYCYGTGIPEYEYADNPLKYKFTWSVEGLLKTYNRPARILENGEVVDIPGDEIFSEKNVHMLDLEGFEGLLECYPNGNSLNYAEMLGIEDQLENMARYTCRWEGHTDYWKTMVRSGFLDEEPLEIDGKQVSPIRFVANLLESQDKFWLKDDERDIAMVRVEACGLKDGEQVCNIYQVIDKKDLETGFTAMQRTVGFTASIGAEKILEGEIDKEGLLSPTDIELSTISRDLKERGIDIEHHIERE